MPAKRQQQLGVDRCDDGELEVSVVLPCLNEERTLAGCIDTINDAFRLHQLSGEIVVADNGSVDGSVEIAHQSGARVVRVKERGYGNALRGGIAAAQGRFVVFADADGSYDFMDVARFVFKLRQGDDLVMGNRFAGKIHAGAMPWLHRYVGNPVLSGLGRMFFGIRIGDFHCGLRGFTKAAYERMELRSTGMEFASEMVIKAALHDLQIGEIPVELRPDGRNRAPHLRTWRDGWRHLRFMMIMCPGWLFWLPGLWLFCVSLLLVIALEVGGLLVGPMRFSIHTMLVAGTAMIVAVQLMTFAIYTERLAGLIGLRGSVAHSPLVLRKLSLEFGLKIGLGLIACGVGLLAWKTFEWSMSGFGPLDPVVTMRVVIPGVLCITHGFQVVFGSFFLSFLNLAESQLSTFDQTENISNRSKAQRENPER